MCKNYFRQIIRALSGCNARMPRTALDISWKSHIINKGLSDDLPKVTRNMQHHLEKAAICLILHKKKGVGIKYDHLATNTRERKTGRPTKTYVDQMQSKKKKKSYTVYSFFFFFFFFDCSSPSPQLHVYSIHMQLGRWRTAWRTENCGKPSLESVIQLLSE